MLKKKVFLITGASGFVGAYLIRKLIKKDASIHLVLRQKSNTWRIDDIMNKVNVHICDLTNLSKLKTILNEIKPTIIYHLAAYGAYSHQKEAGKILKNNIWGTWNLIQATNNINYELFVNTGSSSEYGFKNAPMRETDFLEPASFYAVAKCSQTLLCSLVANQYRKPIVTLRPFSAYGPWEQPTRFIPTLMKALYFGKPMNLVSPLIARDYIYVDDLVNAYLHINKLKRLSGKYFNIGTGIQSTIKQVVKKAVKVTKKTALFNWGKMPSRCWDTTNWMADISLTKKSLNWQPKIDLKTGLKLTWEWFNKYKKFYI